MMGDISAVDGTNLKDFVVIVIGLGVFVLALLGYLKKGIVQPQPLRISQDEIDRRVTAAEEAIAELRREMREEREKHTQAAEERVRRIHARIDAMRADLDARMAHLPAEIVALLKNTGSI